MATVTEVRAALAAQIQDELASAIEGLTSDPRMSFNPTPPYIDVFPGSPFREPLAFGRNSIYYLAVRVRASTAEHEAAQDTLDELMDPESDNSVENAIMSDKTLGGTVQNATLVEGPTGYGVDVGPGSDGSLINVLWRVRVIP